MKNSKIKNRNTCYLLNYLDRGKEMTYLVIRDEEDEVITFAFTYSKDKEEQILELLGKDSFMNINPANVIWPVRMCVSQNGFKISKAKQYRFNADKILLETVMTSNIPLERSIETFVNPEKTKKLKENIWK